MTRRTTFHNSNSNSNSNSNDPQDSGNRQDTHHTPQDHRGHSDPSADSEQSSEQERGERAPRRPQGRTQDRHATWGPAYLEERARRAWAQAHGWSAPLLPPQQPPVNLGPDSAYTNVREPTAAEYGESFAARERETQTARVTARLWQERIRARAEERRRAIWAAMDTGPLLLWPEARPEVLPAQGWGGGIVGEPRMLLLEHPQGPELRFSRGEHVYYSRAGYPSWHGRVEGAERWSTGWRYAVRWQIRAGGERGGTGVHYVWADHVQLIWQDFLQSADARVRRTKPPRRETRRLTQQEVQTSAPSMPSDPGEPSKP